MKGQPLTIVQPASATTEGWRRKTRIGCCPTGNTTGSLPGKSEGLPNRRDSRLPVRSYSGSPRASSTEPATLADTRARDAARRIRVGTPGPLAPLRNSNPCHSFALRNCWRYSCPQSEQRIRKRSTIASVIGAGLLLTTTAYADPYNPADRAIGGGLVGAGTGAIIGAIAGGGHGAGIGAAVGGGLGAVAGAATTPARPRASYRRHYHYVRCWRTRMQRGTLISANCSRPAAC
jgi:hypothetical protein